jgi:hypothetical protein
VDIEEAVGLVFTVVGGGRYKRTLEHDSFVLDTYANTYYWNSRGYGGDVANFLMRFLQYSPEMAIKLGEPAKEIVKPKKHLNQHLAEAYWKLGRHKREFWYSRGYNDKVIDLYKLGFNGEYYTIPFVLKGHLDAVLLRSQYSKWVSELEGSD